MAQKYTRYLLIAGNGKKFSLKVLAPDSSRKLYHIYYRKSNSIFSNWCYLDECLDIIFLESTVRKYFGYLSELRMV